VATSLRQRLICWFANHEGRGLHWHRFDQTVWCYRAGTTVYEPSRPAIRDSIEDVIFIDPYVDGLADGLDRVRRKDIR
jgi:hypothetical protein